MPKEDFERICRLFPGEGIITKPELICLRDLLIKRKLGQQ